jgi:hypothetical protein
MKTKKNSKTWAVVSRGQNGKCDRYLSRDGMAWELDASVADRYERDVAEAIAAAEGDGCEAEEL